MGSAGSTIGRDALNYFRNKRVRIFIHDDAAGSKAFTRWARQLEGIAAKVDGYELSGLITSDGEAVKDLNDLCRIDADCWAEHQAIVESVMHFAKEGRN
jgi:hypothetical protein